MAENVVYVRATRRDVKNAMRQLPKILSGHDAQAQGMAQQLLTRAGMALLGRIRRAFVERSRGGTDDSGLSWLPLKPTTIAYSRRHPGVLHPGKKRAPFKPSWMLTEKQRKRWWQLCSLGGPAFAWLTIKAEGARTLIGTYGDTKVDILRDTGLLLNSLSPGVPGAVQDQVFRVGRGEVTVGTNRKWAAAHHRGVPGKLPQRKLWPDPHNWPAAWWQDIGESMREGLIEVTLFLIQRSAA